jgi:mono/diheme cytochrome c family protein
MVTEVPDYLLQRSRERRAALGLGGDAGGGEAPPAAAGGEATPATSAASATPAVPAPAPIAPGVPDPEPAPPKANVQAALRRKRIPIWAMPVLAGLPIWAYVYAGTLEPPTSEAAGALDVGAQIFAKCASCHGSNGEGVSGPALTGVGETFADPVDQAHWVTLGSTGWQQDVGNTYGDPDKPVTGGMPAWGEELTPEELMSVVAYERSEFGGLDVVEEGLIDAEGNLLVVYDPETGELVDAPAGGGTAAGH